MKRIVFASRNQGKRREIAALLEGRAEVLSLSDFPDLPEVVEDGDSFLANALKKARFVSEQTGLTTLADDSGLEVDVLNGAPGIYSARYAGPSATDEANIEKLLSDLKSVPDDKRTARFRCVLVLHDPDGRYEAFDGTLEGMIIAERRGDDGFGYDPVFLVPGLGRTVAEIPLDEKNKISHRAKALQKLMEKITRDRL